MSTILHESESLTVNRFWGGADRGVCLDLLVTDRDGLATLTAAEAREVAMAILGGTGGLKCAECGRLALEYGQVRE